MADAAEMTISAIDYWWERIDARSSPAAGKVKMKLGQR